MIARSKTRLVGLVVLLASLNHSSFAWESQIDIQINEVGLYGSAWIPWLRGNPTNVDFIIYQAGPTRPLELIRSDLQFASDSGMKVILTLKSNGSGKRDSAKGPGMPSLDDFKRVLDRLEDFPLTAVTIGEENIFWDGRSEKLATLYETLHERYPKRRFFQWYSPSRNINVPGGKWPDLPADGWIFDQYYMPGHVYSAYLQGISAIDVPKVSIVWASPLWRPGGKSREIGFEWWEQDGWRMFYDQVRLNLDHKIPTAFFLYEKRGADAKPIPMFRSKNECTLRFVDEFLNQVLPALRASDHLGALPAEKPEWIPSGCS